MPKHLAPPSEPGDYFASFKDKGTSARIWSLLVEWTGTEEKGDRRLVAFLGIQTYELDLLDFWDGDS